MKNMCKKIVFFIFGIFSLSVFVTAQSQPVNEPMDSVVLPDVTTVISSEDIQIEENAIPDFSGALPDDVSKTKTLPEKIEINIADGNNGFGFNQSPEETRKVFMEGLMQFGYPYLFSGDFSIYQLGLNPFTVRFVHDSLGGYGLNGFESGFFDNATELLAEKTFTGNKIQWNLSSAYSAKDMGLQGLSALYDDVNRRFFSVDFNAGFPFGKNFSGGFDLQGNWFSRYAGFADSLNSVSDSDNIALSVLQFEPEANILWQKNNVSLGLNALWNWSSFLKSGLKAANRADLSFAGRISFPSIDINTSVGSVFLLQPDGIQNAAMIFPFNVGLSGNIFTKMSSLPVVFAINGGLKSTQVDYALLDSENPVTDFTAELLQINREQTDWFASLLVDIPFSSSLTAGLDVNFYKTAFGNGFLCTQEDSFNSITGFFEGTAKDMTRLKTDLSFSVFSDSAFAVFGWQSQWLDVLFGQPKHIVYGSVSFLSGLWEFDGKIIENIGNGQDLMPIIDTAVSYRPASAIKVEFGFTDIIKLFTGKGRVFAEPYINRSGTAFVSVNFMY